MRIKETPVYKYDELSEKAQERARDWYRAASAGDGSCSEWVLDEAKEVLEILGYSSVKIYYSGFSSQGDGAQFVGNFYASDFDGKGTNAVQRLLADRPKDKELARCAHELDAILAKCPKLSASIKTRGHYCHEMATEIDVDLGDVDESLDDADLEALETSFVEVSRDLMRWIYRNLERQYEWEQSDDVVVDNIRLNEYEFTEEGDRA